MALVTAACFSAVYVLTALWDDGTINRLVAPVVDWLGEPLAFGLMLALPGATCALIFALRGRPEDQTALYAAVTVLLTAAGSVVGFLLLFFVAVAG